MITYRNATLSDQEDIAQLHALSWQQNYRGTLTDDYLDHEVLTNRQEVWQNRFSHPKEGQLIDVAMDGDVLVGFVCTFLDYDERGAYLDNLHVNHQYQCQGIGKKLMKVSAQRVVDQRPNSALYLWVLVKNVRGIQFYKRLGGIIQEQQYLEFPSGGGGGEACLMLWEKPAKLRVSG